MKNLFRTFCLGVFLLVCLAKTETANGGDPVYDGVCCQTVANVDCIHPGGWIFDHSVWLAGHTICDD
jgi:hypothetical protein